MGAINRPFLSVLTGIGLLFLTASSVVAEQLSEEPNIQLATTQPQPGSKELDGLEPEPPSPLSFGWDITLASKYLFQGIDYSEGKPVVQPEGIITYKEFSAILWFDHDLDKKVSNEFDLYLQYAQDMENLSLTAGYTPTLTIPTGMNGTHPRRSMQTFLTILSLIHPSAFIMILMQEKGCIPHSESVTG